MSSKPIQKEHPEKEEETRYYQRIIVMVMTLGTETLLKLFKSLIPDGEVGRFLDSKYDEIENLKKTSKLSSAENARISERPLVGTELDMAILIKLLLELLPQKLKQESSNSRPLISDIQQLRKIRNKLIGHRPAATITKEDFDRIWDKVSTILKRILPKDQSMEELVRRIEDCKLGPLSDTDTQKILEMFAKLSSLLTQAEALGEQMKEFQLFFKRTPEQYVRYVKLLFDGGRLVLLGVLYREIYKENATFDRLIRANLEKMPRIIKEFLLPSTSVDPSSLDIAVLAEVILNLFGDRISQSDNEDIKTIRDARINYADFARLSLHESKFLSVWTRLVSSIITLSTDIDENLKGKCKGMIKKYTDEKLHVTSVDEYLNKLQLKTSCMEIRNLKDVYAGMLSELKSLLEKMEDEDLQFPEQKVLELLVTIDCNNPEIKRAVEDDLQANIQTALQAINFGDDNEQPSEIKSLIQDITANEDVTITSVSKKCILIVLQFSTCRAMKHFIQFVQSTDFQLHTKHVSRMLCLEYGEAITLQANITLESMKNFNDEITRSRDDRYEETHGVKISIGCSSVTGVRHVSKVLKKEKITSALNNLANTLSDRFGETVALRSVPDFKEWNDIFHDKGDSSTSNEDDSSLDRFDRNPKEKPDEQKSMC